MSSIRSQSASSPRRTTPSTRICHRSIPVRLVAFFAGEDFGLEQREDLGLERGMHPDPLETGENRRQLVPALERQTNLFNGEDVQIGLVLEWVAHGECLQIRSPKWPKRSKKVQTFEPRDRCLRPRHRSEAMFVYRH